MTSPIDQSVPGASIHNNDQLLHRTLTHQNSADIFKLLNALCEFRPRLFSQNALDTGLITACKIRNPLIVRGLLDHGANLETRDERGMTPLLLCAELSMTELAKILLQRGANVNAISLYGETPLILSTYLFGSEALTKLLLEHPQVDLKHRNNNGYTALMSAIEAQNISVVKVLINADTHGTTDGLPEPQVNNDGETVEDIAQRFGVADLLKLMRDEKRTGVTPLHQAVLNRDIRSVQILTHNNNGAQDNKLCSTLTGFFNSIKGNVQEVEYEIVSILCGKLWGNDEEKDNKEAVMDLALGLADFKLIYILCNNGFIGSYKSLSTAAAIGRRDILCLLLNSGVEVNKLDSRGQIQYRSSPLDQAIQNGQFDCARGLFERGAKIDVKLAMSAAVSGTNINSLQYLVEKFPSDCRVAITQSSFLHEAVGQGDTQTVECLLENGAHINLEVIGKTPLMHAMDVGMIDLLIKCGADVNLETSRKGTPLIYALSHDYHWNIKKRGENIKGIELFDCDERIRDIVAKLLEHGAKCKEVYHNGQSPLSCAIETDHSISLLKMLLEAGADVNDSGPGSTSPLHAASANCSTEKIQYLIDAGADVNNKDCFGQSPIFRTYDPEDIECLIQNGADVNVEDKDGDITLMLAIENGEDIKEILDIFIKAGCDVNHQNKKGFSALMIAAKHLDSDALDALLKAGADVNLCTTGSKPKTTLDILLKSIRRAASQTKECIRLLIAHDVNVLKVNPCVIHVLISIGCLSLATKFISSGIGPLDVPLHKSIKGWYKSEAFISPLGVALLLNNVKLARYFFEIRYLTKSDLSLLRRNKVLSKHLSRDCLQFTQDASQQPLSLETLSFVAVSWVIGAAPGRRARIEKTNLPSILQAALLYTDIPPIVENTSEPRSLALHRSFFKKYQVRETDSSEESVQFSYDDLSSESDF